MTLSKQALVAVKICGGIIFAIQGFFLALFLTWPFGSSNDINYLSFGALILCMAGYITALFRPRVGGSVMIVSVIALVLNGMIASTNDNIGIKLTIALSAAIPVIIVGLLFLLPVKPVKNFIDKGER